MLGIFSNKKHNWRSGLENMKYDVKISPGPRLPLSLTALAAAHLAIQLAVEEGTEPPGVLNEVCARHDISLIDLLGKRRFRHLTLARIEAYGRLRDMGWSYPAIARVFRRHHTTILTVLKGSKHHANTTGEG